MKCSTIAPMIFAPRSSVSIYRSITRDWQSNTDSARGKAMRGGFTFKLSRQWWRPAIQVRRLNARASLIQFTHPPKRRDPRGQRKRKIAPRSRRGSFIDLKTIAAALLSRSFSLASLADFLKTPTRKADSGGHGRQLTTKYLGYLMQDVQVTWECYQNLRDRYVLHALEETPLGKILSEASLGKAYLKQMGVRPFREVQPDFPPRLTGLIMSTYFGGRAEVHWRRELRQVLYCDFLSMYPTVCTLMGLWQFVIAQGMEWSDSTEETRVLVNSISLDDLQQPEFWPLLTTIVRVAPQADISPVRAKYDGKSETIGLNYLTSDSPALVHAGRCHHSEIADRKIGGNYRGHRLFAKRAATRLAAHIDRRQSRLSC